MKKTTAALNPNAYIAALDGWRRTCVEELRLSVLGASAMDEVIKWGHLVFFSNGPVLLIRAEEDRVLFGFWRGQRLREIDQRLRPGGKYEMATIELRENEIVAPATVRRLVREAVRLNKRLGNPTAVVTDRKLSRSLKANPRA